MNIHELKAQHPKRFEREYYSWLEGEPYQDWAEYLLEDFVREAEKAGVYVDIKDVQYSISYSQGDGAAFNGLVVFAEWMKHKGYDEDYLPLYLDAKAYGTQVAIHNRGYRGLNMSASAEYYPGAGDPSGVFADMDPDDWTALCEEQWNANGWEDEVLDTCNDLAHDLYKQLRDEYEHQTSEESFIENCIANDVTFDEDESCDIY
jgi:hypothetical protein